MTLNYRMIVEEYPKPNRVVGTLFLSRGIFFLLNRKNRLGDHEHYVFQNKQTKQTKFLLKNKQKMNPHIYMLE